MTVRFKPRSGVQELFCLFLYSPNHEDQYDRPLNEREVGFLEFTRIDSPGARMRLALLYDESITVKIAVEEGVADLRGAMTALAEWADEYDGEIAHQIRETLAGRGFYKTD